MIINEEVSSPVISNILATPSRFKIKASAKAFKILSGFYSEPILAIPRELGANAWDSHVKAGNTKKMFLVHAPNPIEPWFSVRDFGTGLSPDDIDTIYTTYFESTKTSDNNSDGCMGLGSKTPFNYTDNFNVTSFYNGKKYVYNCFIDANGAPNIMRVTVENTSEHNGLEVKFGVKMADISMWFDKITRAYEPFRNRPTIVGANIVFKPREYIYEGKKWAMRKSEDSYYNRGCNAFMGNYCYPINVNSLRRALHNVPNIGYKLEQALNYGNFDFFFDIGDLDVAPNKEQLQYEDSNATTLAIIAALQTAVAELKELVYKNIETPKTIWESMYLYNKYNGYNSKYSHVRSIIGDIEIKFGAQKIDAGSMSVAAAHAKTNISSFYPNNTIPTYVVYTLESIGSKIRRTNTYYPHSDTKKVIFFYTNSDSIKSSRLRHYLRGKYHSSLPTVFVITDVSNDCDTFKRHKDYFGWDSADILKIEDLPKPPPVPRQKKAVGTDEIWYADIKNFTSKNPGHNNTNISWDRRPETIDGSSTYYYIDFFYADARWDNRSISLEHIENAVKLLVSKKVIDVNVKSIYGINVKNRNLLSVGKWVNICDLAKKELEKDIQNIEQSLYESELASKFDCVQNIHNVFIRNPQILVKIKNPETRNMFQLFMKTFESISRKKRENLSFYSLFGFKAKKHADLGFDVTAFKKLLDEKYMGIFSLYSSHSSENISPICKVINFVDEKSQNILT